MTSPDNRIRLLVGATEYGGWKSVAIQAGIEQQAREFDLTITNKWPGALDIPRRVSPGDACELFIGEDKVLTGYVDATPISYDEKQVTVGVRGRSKTGDLVDCAAINSPGQWRAAKIDRIAADLARPYGVSVVSQVDTGPAMTHAIEQAETVFESIERMLKLRQQLATDDALGRLVFIEVGSAGTATTALELGKNIKRCDAPLDFKDVFTEYIVKGQRPGSDDEYGDTVAGETASITDDILNRRRVLMIKQGGEVTGTSAKDRVRYERAHRKAQALASTYTVQGWRQEDGTLWLHNMLVRVRDPAVGFDDEFVIAEIRYELSEGAGMLCLIKVGPKDGYVPKPEKKKKGGEGGADWSDVKPADGRKVITNKPTDAWGQVKR
ncbi:phage baseplate assembly protein [uncultured Pseudacidovorax sp.]|uniref:phage baseplate assembly protein n=1 Tax=uncultured Pseudacidovorax sp. TaxID=679313 RepID=UPI0025DC24B0|nr:baseplate protein [uncultured Pseudacidovorax sp.]